LALYSYMDSESRQGLEIDAAIARLAVRQHGNVTRVQLVAIGLTDQSIAWRVRRERLFRIHRGVFAVGRPPRTPLERASAAVLACNATGALSHLSAAALWGFVTTWPRHLDVTVTVGNPRPAGITVHRSPILLPRDIRIQLEIRTTSPARTILDCAPALNAEQRLTRTVNDALLSRRLTRTQLADVRTRFLNHPGAALLDPLIQADDGPTRSEFEDAFLRFCDRHGLPRPQVNTTIAGHEVDAVFAAERVIVELDGWRYHADREAFENDRNRDVDTLRAGYVTVRVTWRRLTKGPALEAERLEDVLANARRRRDG
jgi:very-short-patch-repair endonuclease